MRFPTFKKQFHHLYFIFLSLLVIAFLSGCGAKNPGLVSAKIYLGLVPPDYDKAMEQLHIALEQDSTLAEAHFLLGTIYAEEMMCKEMMEEFRKAEKLKLSPKDSVEISRIKNEKWTELVNSAIGYGKKEKAAGRYKIDLMIDFSKYPTYKDSLRALASDLEDAQRFAWDSYLKFEEAKLTLEDLEGSFGKKAQEMYQTAILIDSTRYEAYLNLGAEFARNEEIETALRYYEKAYQLKPDDSGVMTGYATCLLSAKKYDQALGIYEKIIQKDPQNVNALFNLSTIFVQKGDLDKVEETYAKIISIDPEYRDAHFYRGKLHLSKAYDHISVLVAYKDSLQQNPKDEELSSRYEWAKEEYEKLFTKAESDFQKSAEIDASDEETYFHLGLLYISKAQTYNPILSAYRDSLKRRPKDRQLLGRSNVAREEQKKYFNKAETSFQKAQDLVPDDLETLKYLGFSLLSQDKWEESSNILEKLVTLVPNDKEAWGYLSITYARLGEKDKAEEALKKSKQ
ncbi:MAG: tetratricopeptide repeat protein [candidate division Zixibacteria bacterium]|nr:tetratricopeptide repeat protein [candidate division Zixibacteria bacterium]